MKNMKTWMTGLILVLSMLALSACGGSSASASTDATANTANGGQGGQGFGQGGPRFTSAFLNNTYDNALPVTMQLTLGTMKLEGSPNAITADQAGKLLPLWQSLESGSIQNGTEMGAVYKQIEGTMTPTQMQAIAGMKLTRNDMQDWAKSQGIQLPQFFQGQGGTPSPAVATLRAELQNASAEARPTIIAQFRAQNGGGQGGQGGGGQRGQGGQRRNVMLDPLIKLLSARAGK